MAKVTLNEESQASPRFLYRFEGQSLRFGDIVDVSRFTNDATVLRPCCLECGYDAKGDYWVELRAGILRFTVKRSEIYNVRRTYQSGDWAL